MGRAVVALVALAVIVLTPLTCPLAQEAVSTPLRLGTATPGGGFPAFGEALVVALRQVDPALAVETSQTAGSSENLHLLRAGRLDLAFVQGEFAYEALLGEDGVAPLTVVAPMYPTPGLLVVPAASPVQSIEDLRGRAVALGTRGSGLTRMGRLVLQASGLDPDRDVEAVYLERAGDGPALVREGRVAALWGGGLGWPGFLALASAPGGARFIGPSPQAIEALLRQQSAMRRLTVPAGSLPGQTEPIETAGSWSLILARPGLDEATVFRLVQAIDAAVPALARSLPQGRDSDPRNLVAVVPARWLHPGTGRYLRHVGTPPE